MTLGEREFLNRLAGLKQGRCGFSAYTYAMVKRMAADLIEDGHVIERRYGHQDGFQITDKGRAYLGGES